MDYNKIFKDAFSDVALQTNEDSFVKSITERKIAMENKKRISFKKPLAAICVVAATLTLGTVGAAAAGLINFNEIFSLCAKNIICADVYHLCVDISTRQSNIS